VRTVVLLRDETSLTATPPWSCGDGRSGPQVSVPSTGSPKRRIRQGASNVGTGAVVLEVTQAWNQVPSRGFLAQVRSHGCGWNRVRFEDRAGPPTAPDSLWGAACLGLDIRLLPRATPAWNAMETLWKQVKRDAVGARPTASLDQSAAGAWEPVVAMRPHARRRQARVWSGNFWLTK